MTTALTPSRIQRSRARGWRMPPGAVYVGRPTKWGNPFPVASKHPRTYLPVTLAESVALFREYAEKRLADEPKWLDDLRGKQLACWCSLDNECHADVLLELANKYQLPLTVQPVTQVEANAFIRQHHRHHKPPTGWLFGVAVNNGITVVGVATVGRPVARMLDDGLTAEVNRCCTDGTPNACSALYGACWRVAKALGYRRLITYTLPEEGGASLRAAGWKSLGERGGGKWTRAERHRVDTHPTQRKLLWEVRA